MLHRTSAAGVICGLGLIFALEWGTGMTSADAQSLSLADGGEATAVVAVAADAPEVTRFAAEELVEYLGRVTGGTYELIEISDESPEALEDLGGERVPILVGASRYTDELDVGLVDLEPDGFRIVTIPGALVIAGRDSDVNPTQYRSLGSAGSLYGVYRFLEELGCRFYFPTEAGEVIPGSPSLTITQVDITDAPYFTMRLLQPPLSGEEAQVWLRKIGCGATRYPSAGTHSFHGWAKQYHDEHPEYFALVGGRRINHVCFSQPEGRNIMIEQARAWLESHDADLYPNFSVMQNDGAPGPCRCQDCAPRIHEELGWYGLQSEIVAEAAIEVADAISEEFPDRGVIIGAYNDYTHPPVEIDQLPSNVAVSLFKHRQMFWDEEGHEGFKRVLNGWLDLQPKEVCFWEYYNFDCWAGAAWGGVPAVTTDLIAEDIKYLKQRSEETGIPFAGELLFCDGRLKEHWHDRLWWMGLDIYLTGKLLWEPDLDHEAMLDEFFQSFFGPAAEPMQRFYTRAEQVWNEGDHGGLYGYADPDLKTIQDRMERATFSANPWENLFTGEVLDELSEILKQAEADATRAPYSTRVAFVRSGFNWTLEEAAAGWEE